MKRILFVLLLLLLLLLPFSYYAKAQNPIPFCVIRVPGLSETPSSYYGVEYSNAASYTRPAGGFLSIKDAQGIEISVWAPGQWVRIERNRCY